MKNVNKNLNVNLDFNTSRILLRATVFENKANVGLSRNSGCQPNTVHSSSRDR